MEGINMTALEIAKEFEKIAPLDSGIPGDMLGFIWGDPDVQVRGIGCLWCAHTKSIEYCAAHEINLIICHERLFIPGQDSPWYEGPDETSIFSNLKRRELLEKYDIAVYRSHSNWDALLNDGVADSAVTALQLDGLKEIARQKFFSVQELPGQISVQELKQLVEARLVYSGCRIFGDPEKKIRRFAFLIGGFGENQLHLPQAAMEMGAEAVIIGEMSEFIVLACLEMGLPVIESLHSVSEIPGIKRQAEVLAERLPGLPVEYVPSGAASF
jgi:putative NIF3 family GTP cyclohydrolase 1 type 2